MASKADMLKEIIKTRNDYITAFEVSKISEKEFLGWIDQLNVSHRELTRAYSFFFKGPLAFIRYLKLFAKHYRHFDDQTWKLLRAMSNSHKQVVILNETISELKKAWKRRPKPSKD